MAARAEAWSTRFLPAPAVAEAAKAAAAAAKKEAEELSVPGSLEVVMVRS